MNLLIDIGNTNLHWAMQDGSGIGPMDGVRHGGGLPLDLLAVWETLEPPARAVAGNVGGADLGQAVARVVRAYWGLELEFATTCQDYLGLRVAYPEPARLGVDRWLALLAAHGRCAEANGNFRAALIVDAGTAATYDLLAPGGRHLGGLILPGLTMMRDSLLAGTRIPPGEPESTTQPWATDTAAAIATGSVQAMAALTERLHERLHAWVRGQVSTSDRDPLAAVPVILLTGGDAPRIGPFISPSAELVPDLVLRGLARWAAASAMRVSGMPVGA